VRQPAGALVVTDCDIGVAVSERSSGCRVLIVTNDDTEASIRRAMEVGTHGYLLLTSTLDAVVRAVRCVISGGTALDPMIATKIVDIFTDRGLTDRELDVLRLMMLGLSNKAIANSIARSVGTVKSHVKAVRAKLNVTSRTEAVAVAQRRGLVPKGIAIRRPGPAAGEKGYPAAPLIVHQQPSVVSLVGDDRGRKESDALDRMICLKTLFDPARSVDP
jgi:DNA-binding CsgD family transcriptional regulator